MKKESDGNNFFGLLSWSFGLSSLVFAIVQPVAGFILGILGLIMNSKQKKLHDNDWTRVGRILSVIGIIVSIIAFILAVLAFGYLISNPELLAQQYAGGL